VSPKLKGTAGIKELFKVVEVLDSHVQAKCNRSTGFHVHVEASPLSVTHLRNVCHNWVTFESVIDGVMPPSRRGNANQYAPVWFGTWIALCLV